MPRATAIMFVGSEGGEVLVSPTGDEFRMITIEYGRVRLELSWEEADKLVNDITRVKAFAERVGGGT